MGGFAGVGTSCADSSAAEAGSLGHFRLWLPLRAVFLYCLPRPFSSDFYNLIFGAPVEVFQTFVLIAIPLQLLFLLGVCHNHLI